MICIQRSALVAVAVPLLYEALVGLLSTDTVEQCVDVVHLARYYSPATFWSLLFH